MKSKTIQRIFRRFEELLKSRCYEQWGYRDVPEINRQAQEVLNLIDPQDIPPEDYEEYIRRIEEIQKHFHPKNFDFQIPGVQFRQETIIGMSFRDP